jgi:hypothetical protein
MAFSTPCCLRTFVHARKQTYTHAHTHIRVHVDTCGIPEEFRMVLCRYTCIHAYIYMSDRFECKHAKILTYVPSLMYTSLMYTSLMYTYSTAAITNACISIYVTCQLYTHMCVCARVFTRAKIHTASAPTRVVPVATASRPRPQRRQRAARRRTHDSDSDFIDDDGVSISARPCVHAALASTMQEQGLIERILRRHTREVF